MPDDISPDTTRSLQDIIKASKRLRQRAKENEAEADRILAIVRQLEKSLNEQSEKTGSKDKLG